MLKIFLKAIYKLTKLVISRFTFIVQVDVTKIIKWIVIYLIIQKTTSEQTLELLKLLSTFIQ